MEYIEVKAYAKINWILKVQGKRPDGYHELETVFQALDLADRLLIGWEPAPQGLPAYGTPVAGLEEELALDLRTDAASLPRGDDNLAYRAARLMHETFHAGRKERITLDLEKKIPLAAGLGGGSADGAAVLYGLAQLWDLGEDAFERLMELAAALGSDVPFCLMVHRGHRACLARGRGEVLTPVGALEGKVLLTTPDFPLTAAEVYGELRAEDCDLPLDTEAFLAAIAAPSPSDALVQAAPYLGNQLQAPALRLRPQIQASLDWISAQGQPLAVLLAGSGPTVCALYPHGSSLERTCICHGLNPQTWLVDTLVDAPR